MIEITEKEKCTGCGACRNVCPKDAIELREDGDGFWYPEVNPDTCVNCHLCEKVCPFHNTEFTDRKKIFANVYFSGQLKDQNALEEVSSGGAAWGLAQAVLNRGGVVYGVRQTDVDVIEHVRVETLEDVQKTRRSKYFQSDTGLTFRQVKEDLEQDRLVLYTGVGCQIAGLKSYLGRDDKNLITADMVCHGVPSRKAWRSYRNYIEIAKTSEICDLVFRDKSAGWANNQYRISFADGTTLLEKSVVNPFHKGYLEGLYSRPSCGACIFNLFPRVADYTFADYWQYDGQLFQKTKKKGISLICVNTPKGAEHLPLLEEYLQLEATTEENALRSARHLSNAPKENEKRNEVMSQLTEDNFAAIWETYIKEPDPGLLVRTARKVKGIFK